MYRTLYFQILHIQKKIYSFLFFWTFVNIFTLVTSSGKIFLIRWSYVVGIGLISLKNLEKVGLELIILFNTNTAQ